MDFNVELKSGKLLRGVIHTPGDNPSGVIVFVHGIGEHLLRYDNWAQKFKKGNYAFTGVDLPGHGRSEGRRGVVRSYAVLHEMIDIMLKTANRTFPGIPVFLYGHSLGGGIVLDYALRFNPSIRGLIVTSPWLKLAFEPPKVKLMLAAISRRIIPGIVQPTGLETSYLSHDKSVVDRYNSDPLVHDRISAGFFAGAMNAAKYSLENAAGLKIPTLLVHGSDDMVCSPKGSVEFASRTSMAEMKLWDGGYHELHNEPFSDEVFNFILEWIRKSPRKN